MARKNIPCIIAPAGALRTAFGAEALLIGAIWGAFPDVPRMWVTRPTDGWGQPIEGAPWIIVVDGAPPAGMPELLFESGGYYLEPLNLGLPCGIADGFDPDDEPTDGPAEPGHQCTPAERDGRPYFTIPAGRVRNVIRTLRENRVLFN